MLTDLRFAFRILLKQPGFTAVAVLTMAIAIGVTSALFSVVNAVVLRPIEYPQPDSLIRVWVVNPARNVEFPALSWPRYEFLRDNTTMLASMAVSVNNTATLTNGGEADQVASLLASANFFSTLGLSPKLGRFLEPAEDQTGGANVVLISQRIWQNRFGGASDVVGRMLTVDGVPHQVIGVLPTMPVPYNQVDLLLPRPLEVSFIPVQARNGGASVWQVTARLKPGVTLQAAEGQLKQLDAQLREKRPEILDTQDPVQLRRFADEIIPAQLRLASGVLLGAVGAVLLIACANVANLSLARLTARGKEIAVRASLGAGRRALVQQFLIESLVIAVAGGVLGVLLAAWSLDGIRLLATDQIPRIDQVSLDATTVVFTLVVTVLSALLVGLYPAWQAAHADLQTVLKDSGRGNVSGRSGKTFRSALVVAEVAVSLVLLIGAGLLLYSFGRLQRTPLGFEPAGVSVGTINLPLRDYPTPEKQREFARLLDEKLRTAPELASAGLGLGVPMSQAGSFTPYAVGGQALPPIAQRKLVGLRIVTPGFFRALGIALKEGRLPADTDRTGSPLVGVINESFARKIFPDRSAIGQQLLFGVNGERKCEIVGITADVKGNGVAAPVPDEIYFASAQRGAGFFQVVGKAKGDLPASAVVPALRRAVREVDPNVALATPQTMAELVAQNLQATRALSVLLAGFAALAGLLAIVGIYSVIAYNVTQRTAEIGVRLALGATAGNIFQLVLRSAGLLVGLGLGLGLVGAFLVGRVLRQLLFEVQPFDPAIFGLVAAAFAVVGLVAALIPARRASQVDPLTALRAD